MLGVWKFLDQKIEKYEPKNRKILNFFAQISQELSKTIHYFSIFWLKNFKTPDQFDLKIVYFKYNMIFNV